MPQSNADRNVLFGVLAVQNSFVARDTLVAGMNAWVHDKSKSLGQVLVDRQVLNSQTRDLLEALTEEQLKRHDEETETSLATLGWTESLRQDLLKIADSDLQQTLSRLPPPAVSGSFGAEPVAIGTASSSGVRFRILRPHARGGLGEVYVAVDEELHREVALKRIQAPHADSPESRARFILEAEITGGLEHPSIVPVYGLGAYPDGRPFYAMRFIRGDTLKEALDKFHQSESLQLDAGERSLEFRKLLGRFIDVCDAMEYAHSRGILHRDLKPGNIMLGNYGETLVVDWGLAKPRDSAEPASGASDRRLRPSASGSCTPTQMGSTVGTPQYMSPEQAEGQLDLLGPASDVYSLGATLYCLLTGRPPLVERDVTEVIRKVRQGEFAAPRVVKPSIPKPLEAICLRAMALKPEERYASARALADDLEHWLADEPVSAFRETLPMRLARWARRHRTLVQVGGLALAAISVIAVAAAVMINRAREETERQKARAEISFQQAREAVDGYYTETSESKLLNEPGLQGLRRELLETALRYYQAFIVQREGDASVQEELAMAHFRVGKITSEIGSKLAAFTEFEQARQLQDELTRRHPGEPRFTYELSNSWNELGRLYLETGEFDRAQQAFERSRDLRQQLVTLDPKNPEYERKLANSFMNQGAVCGSRNEYDDAVKRIRQAVDIQQRLATAHPQDAVYRRDLAKGLYNLAVLENRAGRPADALKSCRQAMSYFQQLYDEQPRVIDFQGLAALSMRLADEMADQSGKSDEALAVFQQARQLTERLVQRNPLVSDYRAELAAILARIARRTADPEQALQYHMQAKDLLVQLVQDNPQVVHYQSELADDWLDIGQLNLQLAHSHEALQAFQNSLKTSQALAAQDGNSETAQDALARALNNIAGVERTLPDKLADARTTYEQVLKIYQAMAEKRPASPQVQEGLGRTYFNLGEVDDHLKKPTDALVEYRAAMEHQHRAVELAPQSTGFQERLLKQCGELAAVHRQSGRPSEALEIGLEHKKLARGNAQALFEAARSLALTAAAIGASDGKLPDDKKVDRKRAVNSAIESLRDAIAAGLKDAPKRLADLDLNSLNDEPAFRELQDKAGK